MAEQRCPVCGTAHAACGTPTTVVGVDELVELETKTMAELKEYTVVVNGHETVMSLTEQDAQRLGGTPVGESSESSEKARQVSTKARTARNKSAASDDE